MSSHSQSLASVPAIVLVGPMGVGKSTIGKSLAVELGRPFLDTDHIIEERAGADIGWIFDVEGEVGFRQREHALLEELIQNQHQASVIATGGGIVVSEENRQLIGSCDLVIYLKAEVEQLIARTARDKKRPLLQVADRENQVRKLMLERDPLYQAVSNIVVSADKRGPRQVVEEIIQLIKERYPGIA